MKRSIRKYFRDLPHRGRSPRNMLFLPLAAALLLSGATMRETEYAGFSPEGGEAEKSWTDKQSAVHEIAEQARAMGLDEDNPIIVECRRIWHEEEAAKAAPVMTYLGRYYITGYDICVQCCGKTNGITAGGTSATVGRTCAANGMDFGTRLYIDGIGERVVEDRGGMADDVIDVLCEDHAACYAVTGWYDVYAVED